MENVTEFEKYLEVGRAIRAHNFDQSTLGYLDTMSASISEYFVENPASIHRPRQPIFNSSFVALVAPSLEGKTQSAFVFRKSKVAYFVIYPEAFNITSSAITQEIYKCFTRHSVFLKNIVVAGMARQRPRFLFRRDNFD